MSAPVVVKSELRVRLGHAWGAVESLGSKSWAVLGVAVIVLAAGWGLWLLGWLLYPLIFGVVLGVLAAPLVQVLVNRRLPRLAATIGVFAAIVVGVVAVVWVAVPPFVEQASRLAARFPEYLDSIAESISGFQRRLAGGSPATSNAVESFSEGLREQSLSFADGLSDTFFGVVQTTFQVAVAGLLGAIIAFLAVKDMPAYTAAMRRWLDREGNERLGGALRQMSRTVTGFIRGQLILALLVGVLSGAVLGILGVPFFIPLGAVAAIGDLIPTVGPILAAIPAVVLAFSEGGIWLAVAAAIAFTAVQQLEAYVFVPLIVGKAVDLPALVVIVALTVAGAAFGVIGLLLAVPVVAVARDAVRWFFMTDSEARIEAKKLALETGEIS